jgi:CheY-like chemotaxis protein
MKTGQKILIVDDSPDSLTALSRLLRRRGYDVTSVASAEDALRAMEKLSFHLLITDWRLPGIDGLSLAQQAHAKDPHIKVLTLTAYEDSYDKARLGCADNVDAHLTKPFDPPQLLALVTDLLCHPCDVVPCDAEV